MNNQLIEKVIKSSTQACPDFTYSNPILDRNVARSLAKSFVKILSLSKQNSNINNNLRQSVLENIRKMCQIDPEDHMKVDENVTSILTEFYDRHLRDTSDSTSDDTSNKNLDTFLMRRMKVMNIEPNYKSSFQPELIQALINFNENGFHLETLSKDIIHWKSSGKHLKILKDLWSNTDIDKTLQNHNMFDDISIKIKSEIEILLVGTVHDILNQKGMDIENIFQCNKELKNLVIKSSVSMECFQICSAILNSLLIMTKYDVRIQKLVLIFVTNVKKICSEPTFSVLYPVHLTHIVVLLDFDVTLDTLPLELKELYIQPTLKYLQSLHRDSEYDLILLLSHFPQWFDIYYDINKNA